MSTEKQEAPSVKRAGVTESAAPRRNNNKTLNAVNSFGGKDKKVTAYPLTIQRDIFEHLSPLYKQAAAALIEMGKIQLVEEVN